MKECCWTEWGSNPCPADHQSDTHLTELPRPATPCRGNAIEYHRLWCQSNKKFLKLLSPRFLEKASGILLPSVCYVISSQTAGQNPTKFDEWLAYTSGACKSRFIFGPAPRGPGEGSKGQILTISNFKVNFKDFYAKMCTYTQ